MNSIGENTKDAAAPARPAPLLASAVLALAAFFAAPLLMAGDVYRWIDANGVVNYTQQKPDGVSATLISDGKSRRRSSRSAPESAAAGAVATVASTEDGDLNAGQQKMLDELKAKEAERKIAYEAAKKDNCARSRSLLSKLSARGRIRLNQEDGSQIVMREEDRQARIQAAQQGVIDNC
jgi:hypothetical protein